MRKIIKHHSNEQINWLMYDFFRESTLREIKNREGVILVLSDKNSDVINSMTEYQFNIIQLKQIEQVRTYITNNSIRLFIMNMYNDDGYGMELLSWISENYYEIPVIVILQDERKKFNLEKQFPQIDIMIQGNDTYTKYKKVINLDLNSFKGM